MPVITIKTHSKHKNLNLKNIAEDISKKSGIEIKRLNVMVQYYEEQELLGSIKEPVLIHIGASDRNGQEVIQKLMKSAQTVLMNVTGSDRNQVSVYCHPIPVGFLLVDNKFH